MRLPDPRGPPSFVAANGTVETTRSVDTSGVDTDESLTIAYTATVVLMWKSNSVKGISVFFHFVLRTGSKWIF